MPNEACFLYMLEGQIDYKTQLQSISIPVNEAVLLKCGNYFSQMKSSTLLKTIRSLLYIFIQKY